MSAKLTFGTNLWTDIHVSSSSDPRTENVYNYDVYGVGEGRLNLEGLTSDNDDIHVELHEMCEIYTLCEKHGIFEKGK